MSTLDREGRARVQTINDEPSRTVESDRHLTDIAVIMSKMGIDELGTMLDAADLQYADVTELTDYAQVMAVAKQAEQDFMRLPSKVREMFNHDVANWLDAAQDPEKRDEINRQLAGAGSSGSAAAGDQANAAGGVGQSGGDAARSGDTSATAETA